MRMLDRKIKGLIAATNVPEKEVIYGVKIALGNSDPSLSVTYTDDAASFSPSRGNNGSFIDNGWKNRFPFNKIKPCLLKNGVVQYYLNPDDFTKKLDGNSSDLISGNDGNVMIEFPKIWYSIEQDSSYIYIKYSNTAQVGFTDWAMSYKGVIKDRFFIGAYLGRVIDEHLCSLSGKLPNASIAIGSFRNYAQANGDSYEILSWNKLILLQILYLVRFKSLDGQTALGNGDSTGGVILNTGSTNSLGMNYGTTGYAQMKFCGIEDFWGNLAQFIDGIILNADGLGDAYYGNIATADGNFNDTANGYTIAGAALETLSGYITGVCATNKLGFIASETGGSLSTYFCDNSYLTCDDALAFPNFGGNCSAKSLGGPFEFCLYINSTDLLKTTTARLMYCG